MICDFVVGDEVVCIDARICDNGGRFPFEEGSVHIVSSIVLGGGVDQGKILVTLGNELLRKFRHERFRKLQKKKTDISQFKTTLNNDMDKNVKELREKDMKRDLQPV